MAAAAWLRCSQARFVSFTWQRVKSRADGLILNDQPPPLATTRRQLPSCQTRATRSHTYRTHTHARLKNTHRSEITEYVWWDPRWDPSTPATPQRRVSPNEQSRGAKPPGAHAFKCCSIPPPACASAAARHPSSYLLLEPYRWSTEHGRALAHPLPSRRSHHAQPSRLRPAQSLEWKKPPSPRLVSRAASAAAFSALHISRLPSKKAGSW